MSFDDLPDDWPMRSLREEALARDVLDLCVSDRDREGPGIAVLLCGPDGRLQQPVVVSDVTPEQDLAEDCLTLRTLVLHPLECDRCDWHEREPLAPAVLLAVVRPVGRLDDTDRAWHQRAIAVCRSAGVDLLGTHLVTAQGVETLPSPRSDDSAA